MSLPSPFSSLLRHCMVCKFPPYYLVCKFPRTRYFRVKMGKIKSDWQKINAGVRQGTILAPLFFLIMINDLATILPLYKYVDDCTAYEAVSRSTNYTMLNIVITGTEANNMRLNIKKTKELWIS